jgi:hypothetical protein
MMEKMVIIFPKKKKTRSYLLFVVDLRQFCPYSQVVFWVLPSRQPCQMSPISLEMCYRLCHGASWVRESALELYSQLHSRVLLFRRKYYAIFLIIVLFLTLFYSARADQITLTAVNPDAFSSPWSRNSQLRSLGLLYRHQSTSAWTQAVNADGSNVAFPYQVASVCV